MIATQRLLVRLAGGGVALVALVVACGGDDRRPGSDAATDAALPDAPDVSVPQSEAAVCETLRATAEPLPATLLFQLDLSNSMNCRLDQPGCLTAPPSEAPDTRWNVFRDVFAEALAGLPDATRVALMRYPRPGGACATDELVAPFVTVRDGLAALDGAVRAMVADGISTPTHDAVLHGYARLRADGGPRPHLVLMTDGDARMCVGCVGCDNQGADNEQMIVAVARAHDEDEIPTFVLGVPGADVFARELSRMARAGGTAREPCEDGGPARCHLDVSEAGVRFGELLRDALATIDDAIVSCEYEIPPNPDGAFDPGRVNVRIRRSDGDLDVPRDPARADGWDYDDEMRRVELHGTACERARGSDAVEVLFGCPTILI